MSQKVMVTMLLATLAIGCASIRTDGFDVSIREGEAARIINVDNHAFAQVFSLESANVRREPSGYSTAHVQVRNTWREDVFVQYKFSFFDGDGIEVQPGARAWQQTTIHGGESVSLSATAPEKSVVRFCVRVRKAM